MLIFYYSHAYRIEKITNKIFNLKNYNKNTNFIKLEKEIFESENINTDNYKLKMNQFDQEIKKYDTTNKFELDLFFNVSKILFNY